MNNTCDALTCNISGNSTDVNNNTVWDDYTDLTSVAAVDVCMFIFACFLAVFICTGNITTIVAISKTPSLRILPNLYVASLAFADFIVGLGCGLLALFILPPTRVLLFFRFIHLCVLMQGLNMGMCAVSVLHMSLISIDRFLYITQPYLYERVVKIRVAVVILVCIWVFGIIYSMLPQFIHIPYGPQPLCDVTKVLPIGYLFYSSYAIYFSMVLIIVIMYSYILRTAVLQQKAINAVTVIEEGTKGRRTTAKRKSAWKSVKFFFIVFGVFFVCLTPVVVCFSVDYYYNVPGEIYRLLNLVAIMNSGMNFVIFAILKKQFRQSFFQLLGLKVCVKIEPDRKEIPLSVVSHVSYRTE